MAIVEKHEPGTPSWVELCTSDVAGAKSFYSGLFGWTFTDMPTHGEGVFSMFHKNGLPVGAAYTLGQMHKEKEIAPHWLVYFATEDVDATVERVREAQGGVLFGPFDIPNAGRSVFLADRHGAMFACWQAHGHIGAGIAEEPGTLCWPELATPDMQASKDFYTHVFGWETKSEQKDAGNFQFGYTEWIAGGKPIGGCLPMTAEWKGIPPHWMPYFQVESITESCDKVRALGGTVKYGPLPAEGVGEFAVILDPQGVVLSIIEMNG